MIDTHAHLNNEKLFDKRQSLIESAKHSGVNIIVNVGSDFETSKQAVALTQEFDNLFAVVGFHPHNAFKFRRKQKKQIKALAKHKKVVAIGEIGLDFYYNHSKKRTQKSVFKKQIKLAHTLGLPIVIHSRNATEKVLKVLEKNKKFIKNGGIIHCFGDDAKTAKRFVDLGFYLGIGGLITFKNSNLKHTVKQVGLEYIVFETDCPYLAPVPYRGKINQPAYVKHVCDFVAQHLGVESEKVKKITTENAKKVYRL